MKSRFLAAWLLVGASGCRCDGYGSFTGGGGGFADGSLAPRAADPQVRQDVEGLRDLLELPAGVTSCRWLEHRLGDGILGPSDAVVRAFCELSPSGWTDLLQDGADGLVGETFSLELDPSLARTVLPASVVATVLEPKGDRVFIPALPLPSDLVHSVSVLTVRRVDRVGNGLWIEAHTM